MAAALRPAVVLPGVHFKSRYPRGGIRKLPAGITLQDATSQTDTINGSPAIRLVDILGNIRIYAMSAVGVFNNAGSARTHDTAPDIGWTGGGRFASWLSALNNAVSATMFMRVV